MRLCVIVMNPLSQVLKFSCSYVNTKFEAFGMIGAISEVVTLAVN